MSSTKVKRSFKILSIIMMFAICLVLPFLINPNDGLLSSASAAGDSAIVTVEVEDNIDSKGTYNAVAYDTLGKVIPFTSGQTFATGTKIVIEPSPNEGYEFSCFDVNGLKVYRDLYSFVVDGTDIDIKVEFSSKRYELVFKTVDTSFNEISNQKIDATIKNVGAASVSPASRYVSVGDEIENVKYTNGVNLENYTFVAWQVKDKTGHAESISDEVVNSEIRNLDISADFLSEYALNGKIEIYGVFAQKSYLSLHLSVAGDVNELVSVYATVDDQVQKITDLSQPFEYGSVVTITANNQKNLVFTNFSGVIHEDVYLPGQSTVRIVMNGNRAISVGFDYVKTPIKVETISNDKHVEVVFGKNDVHIGETLVISLKINDGYVLKNFTICDKSAEEFVRMLNLYGVSAQAREDIIQAATYDNRGVITIRVTENIFNYFKTNPNLFVSATVRPYGTYIALIVIYILLVLGLGAVIITFSVLYQRQTVKVKALRKKQEQELLERKENEEKKLYKEEQELKKKNVKPKTSKSAATNKSEYDAVKTKIKQTAAKKANEKTKETIKAVKSKSQKKSTKEGK